MGKLEFSISVLNKNRLYMAEYLCQKMEYIYFNSYIHISLYVQFDLDFFGSYPY